MKSNPLSATIIDPMQEILQFDALVHPDFHLMWGLSSLTSSHTERRKKWDDRVAELGDNPQALMLYFSAFLRSGSDADHLCKVRGVDYVAYRVELERIRRYKKQLGESFILFAGNHRPSKVVLERILGEREFLYTPAIANLVAYGEYERACVDGWRRHLTNALELREEHSHSSARLSLRMEAIRSIYSEKQTALSHLT